MGGIPKKFSGMRALLLCLAVVFSLVSVMASVNLFRAAGNDGALSPNAYDPADPDYAVDWINLASGYFTNRDDLTKTVRIQTEGELANLNRIITNNDGDYSGWTFILDRDLDLLRYASNADKDTKVKVRWTPIKATPGSNTGIIIDGNGKSIKNMYINLTDDATPQKDDSGAVYYNTLQGDNGVGFFGTLAGCTVRNLTFENPVIEYKYTGNSIPAQDENGQPHPDRPTAPVKVAVGVVAGIAENAYVSSVTITNPQVNVTAYNNANGHSFYVGTAAGKMVYNDKAKTPLLQSLTNPDEDPEHHWGVDSLTITGGTVGLTVKSGDAATTGAYGVATNGYLGGVVGYNNSGKIINSIVKNLTVNPQMAGVAGTYHAGGLVGYTITRGKSAEDEEYYIKLVEIALGGVINNALIDTTVGSGQATYTGILAGYVYNSWIYNNVYLGNATDLFGAFYNRMYVAFADNCLANVDYETFLDNNNYFRVVADETLEDGDKVCNAILRGRYVECGKHNVETITGQIFPCSGSSNIDSSYVDYANQYNYQMTKDEFKKFNTKMLDGFENPDGNFWEIGTQRVKNEYRTEVNATNIRTAVNELRTWKTVNGEPQFGDNLGYDYDVIFHANGNNMPHYDNENKRCNAGWVVPGEYVDTIDTELVVKLKYKDPILKLKTEDEPTCVGWNFSKVWYKDKECTIPFTFYDEDQTVIMPQHTIELYAKWEIAKFLVTYYLEENYVYKYDAQDGYDAFDGAELVEYGSAVIGPRVQPDLSLPKYKDDPLFLGKSFTGVWLQGIYEYDENEKKDVLNLQGDWTFAGSNDDDPDAVPSPMPGEPIALYAGLQDDYEELREVLDSTDVTDARNNQDYYTVASFANFDLAYNNGLKVMQAHNLEGDLDPELKELAVETVIERLRNALKELTVDLDKLKNLAPFNNDLDQNKYPFLYDYNAYKEYTEIKRTATNYLNVEINNAGMLNNVERYKYIRDTLMTKYNNLLVNRNPNIGLDANLINDIKRSYSEIMAEIDLFSPDDYTSGSWQDSNFDLQRSNFKAAFKNDYSNPVIADLKAAIDNYNAAKAQLVRTQGTGDNGNGNGGNGMRKGGMSLTVVGVLIALVAVLGVGGYVGVDIYLNKKVRPQKEQAEKAEQAAAEDTYI